MTPRLLYTVDETAEQMRIARSQVYVLIASGDLEAVNVTTNQKGRPRLRVPHAAIEKFMRARSTVPAKKKVAA